MTQNNKILKSVLSFSKKYAYFIASGVLVVAIALTLILTSNSSQSTKIPTNDNVVEVNAPSLTFSLPLSNPIVLQGYSASELQYNSTLKHWEIFKALNITSSDNADVLCCLDGKVLNVSNSYEGGYMVEVEHAGGYKTYYASLSDNVVVAPGDEVKKGEKIGEMSNSAANEQALGAHLHFEMTKDGSKVDPSNYLELEEK